MIAGNITAYKDSKTGFIPCSDTNKWLDSLHFSNPFLLVLPRYNVPLQPFRLLRQTTCYRTITCPNFRYGILCGGRGKSCKFESKSSNWISGYWFSPTIIHLQLSTFHLMINIFIDINSANVTFYIMIYYLLLATCILPVMNYKFILSSYSFPLNTFSFSLCHLALSTFDLRLRPEVN